MTVSKTRFSLVTPSRLTAASASAARDVATRLNLSSRRAPSFSLHTHNPSCVYVPQPRHPPFPLLLLLTPSPSLKAPANKTSADPYDRNPSSQSGSPSGAHLPRRRSPVAGALSPQERISEGVSCLPKSSIPTSRASFWVTRTRSRPPNHPRCAKRKK